MRQPQILAHERNIGRGSRPLSWLARGRSGVLRCAVRMGARFLRPGHISRRASRPQRMAHSGDLLRDHRVLSSRRDAGVFRRDHIRTARRATSGHDGHRRDGLRRRAAHARLRALANLCGLRGHVAGLGGDERRGDQHHRSALVRQTARSGRQSCPQRCKRRRRRHRATVDPSHWPLRPNRSAVLRRRADACHPVSHGGARAAIEALWRVRLC